MWGVMSSVNNSFCVFVWELIEKPNSRWGQRERERKREASPRPAAAWAGGRGRRRWRALGRAVGRWPLIDRFLTIGRLLRVGEMERKQTNGPKFALININAVTRHRRLTPQQHTESQTLPGGSGPSASAFNGDDRGRALQRRQRRRRPKNQIASSTIRVKFRLDHVNK